MDDQSYNGIDKTGTLIELALSVAAIVVFFGIASMSINWLLAYSGI